MPPKAKPVAAPSLGIVSNGAGTSIGVDLGTSPRKAQGAPSPLGRAGASMFGSPRKPSTGTPTGCKASSKAGPLSVGGVDRGSMLSEGVTATASLRSNASAKAGGRPDPASDDLAPSRRAVASTAPAPKAAGSAPAVGPEATEIVPETLLKFHSAVRWAKPWEEIEAAAAGAPLKQICSAQDPKNGNSALHIASQNGHLEIVQKMVAAGAELTTQNGKGQTPLHMSVEYDFYFVSKFLLESGADGNLENADGNKAILGIDGGKTGLNAWDNPVTILRAANSREEIDMAFTELENCAGNPERISKEQLIQVGMAKKKSPATKDMWDHKRFMTLAAKF